MKPNRALARILAAVAGALAFAASIAAAHAAGPQIILCPSSRAQANSAAGQISIPNLSQTYAADGQGCVVASGLGDIAIFQAAGYVQPGKERSIVFNTGVATATTVFAIPNLLPAGAYIQQIIFNNTTANAAGNVSVGSTSGAADVVAAVALGANGLLAATLAKTVFSASASQQLFLTSTAWNSANVNVTVVFGYF
jgi:hypothetical protein